MMKHENGTLKKITKEEFIKQLIKQKENSNVYYTDTPKMGTEWQDIDFEKKSRKIVRW